MGWFSALLKWFRGDFLGSFTSDIITKKVIPEVGQKISKKVFEDQRGELLQAFSEMDPTDTINLWRRHKEALAANRENRFVTLLLKLPRIKVAGRKNALKWMNDLSDDQFNQALEMLENDVVAQATARSLDFLKKKIEEIDKKIGKPMKKMAKDLKKTNDELRREKGYKL